MKPNAAEPTVIESVGELALPPREPALPRPASPPGRLRRSRADGERAESHRVDSRRADGERVESHRVDSRRADGERAVALRDTWRALWSSRLLVWGIGIATVLAFGFGPQRGAFNPPGLSRGLGALGDVLAAPVARWDSNWYLLIAHYGYHPALGAYTVSRSAFFPLYPLGLSLISGLGVPPVAAGVLLSVCALAAALYGLHRLTTLELGAHGGSDVARIAVYALAFAPMTFFLSAVYSESLYLALSIGLFWSARQGRWGYVGLLGALASATRSTGVVLLVPALILYLYGPRRDRPPDRARAGIGEGWRRLLPRYRVRREVLWLALVPAGLVAYGAYLGAGGGDPLAPLSAQGVWSRHFAGPFLATWDGLKAAFDGARQLISMQRTHLYFPVGGEDPFVAASHNLILFAFLAAAVPAVIGVVRRLPLAYGAYVVAALALPLSYPVSSQPLMSLPRFLLVLFPLFMWLGDWLVRHPRAQRPMLAGSVALMVVFGAQFATWHWVA
ncbi:MAG TPA: mannosyltransferase family protein [Solirubrobacteraceae bacterium]|nr:mannosyltransferase family protein [Solirubrobacteraceae bacterium]